MPHSSSTARRTPWRGEGRTLAAVALGGGAGAAARYGATLLWPTAPDSFPWTTLAVNVLGCALIGVLMATLAERGAHPLLRPALGTGVLGGFTTFSAYTQETERLLAGGQAGRALLYLAGTLAAALAAVWLASAATRRLLTGGAR